MVGKRKSSYETKSELGSEVKIRFSPQLFILKLFKSTGKWKKSLQSVKSYISARLTNDYLPNLCVSLCSPTTHIFLNHFKVTDITTLHPVTLASTF